MPMSPPDLKAKAINPKTLKGGVSTNYSRSNVEAPGSNVAITMAQKSVPPPPIRV